MREVRFFKTHIREYETELRNSIREEFRDTIEGQTQAISSKDKQINDMHGSIMNIVNETVLKSQIKCNEKIRIMAVRAQNLDDLIAEQKLRREGQGEEHNIEEYKHKLRGTALKKTADQKRMAA